MSEKTLEGRKLEAYIILKIIKYCTGSSARSYQCKYAVKETFVNKSIKSMDELGAAIKEIIQYYTIRGKFSSIHPDLAAEGITKVEVKEEGLNFITNNEPGFKTNWSAADLFQTRQCFYFTDEQEEGDTAGHDEAAERGRKEWEEEKGGRFQGCCCN